MKLILFLLLTVSCAFALHDPTDPVIINMQGTTADGSNGRLDLTGVWATLRSTTSSTSQRTQDNVAVDTGVFVARLGGDSLLLYRSYFQSDSLEAYADSFSIDPLNSWRMDSLLVKFYATNAVAGGCGWLYLVIQNPCTTSAQTVPIDISTLTFNDWLTSPTVWRVADSVAVDTNVIGIGDTAQITFNITNSTILDYVECIMAGSGVAAQPGLFMSVLACYDYYNTDPALASNTVGLRVDLFYEESTGRDPSMLGYWSEIEPGSPSVASGFRGPVRNEFRSGWRNLWR